MDVVLEHSVGAGGRNLPVDVAAVEDLLNRATATTELPVRWDGVFGATLGSRIEQFQQQVGHAQHPDGRVDPHGHTLALLNDAAHTVPIVPTHRQGASAYAGWTRLDIDKLVLLYGLQFGSKPAGLSVLTAAIKRDPVIQDIRWAAYMLATAWRETGRTFAPVPEIGEGAGHDYGNPVTYTDGDGKQHTNTYYGRGYVQLTWLDKYLALGQAIGQGDALAIDPEKALDPKIAYDVMSYGMTNGWFTTAHHKLADYIHDETCDYLHARRIINAMDHAQEIAAIAVKLEMLLRLASE